jgi:hypothetical protein
MFHSFLEDYSQGVMPGGRNNINNIMGRYTEGSEVRTRIC